MNPTFPTNISIFLTILAAFMWGTWMMVVKYRGSYPVTGIVFWLYSFSLILVSAVALAVCASTGIDFWAYTSGHGGTVIRIIFSGALMSCGMYFSLEVISSAGLLLSSAISTSLANILGVITTLVTEGAPSSRVVLTIYVIATVLFIGGGMVCNAASGSHDRDRGKTAENRTITLRVLLYAVLAALLTNGWAIGTATGTAGGVPPIVTCFYMALGCFLGAAVLCSISFTRKHQWRQILFLDGGPKKPLLLGTIAACCHYGGNLISIFCMPALSATLSFLLGRVYGMVTILWGLILREFVGASRHTKLLLALGILMNLAALVMLGFCAS